MRVLQFECQQCGRLFWARGGNTVYELSRGCKKCGSRDLILVSPRSEVPLERRRRSKGQRALIH